MRFSWIAILQRPNSEICENVVALTRNIQLPVE